MTPPAFKDMVVLRDGDTNGDRMIIKLTTHSGVVIHAIAVPQDRPSRTGPTWTYLFESDGLTIMDAGATGSYDALADGLRHVGCQVTDIDRVVISHGHQDHDGAAARLVGEADAEFWAHDIYAHLLPHNPWDLQRRPASLIQEEMHRVVRANMDGGPTSESRDSESYRSRHAEYIESRKAVDVTGRITAGTRAGSLEFMSAPGHSPDEICASMDGVVFTGDHVLPEITPHPTMKTQYSPEISNDLPEEYRDAGAYYGLYTYLKSLQQVVDLGPEVTVLPAHRLFNRGKFNFQTVSRATEVIEHHEHRLRGILRRVGVEPTPLEDVTKGIFSRRTLIGGNLFMALSEIVAHVEMLEDAGDLDVADDGRLRATGSENYRRMIQGLGETGD